MPRPRQSGPSFFALLGQLITGGNVVTTDAGGKIAESAVPTITAAMLPTITFAMLPLGIVRTLYSQAAVLAGDTIATFAGAKNFASAFTIPSGTITRVGQVIEIEARGVYSARLVAPGTMTLGLKLGTIAVAAASGLGVLGGATNRGWVLTVRLVVTTVPTAQVAGLAEVQGATMLGAAAGLFSSLDLVNTAPIAFGTVQDLSVTVQGGWSASDAGNSVSMRQLVARID